MFVIRAMWRVQKFPKLRFLKRLSEISRPKISTILVLEIEFFSFLGLRSQIMWKEKYEKKIHSFFYLIPKNSLGFLTEKHPFAERCLASGTLRIYWIASNFSDHIRALVFGAKNWSVWNSRAINKSTFRRVKELNT